MHSSLEVEIFRVLYHLQTQINIQALPIQMFFSKMLDMNNIVYGFIFEPGEIFIRQKILFAVGQYPETMTGNVGYFSFQNVSPMLE